MTVRCLDCAKFSVQQATPSMQAMGYGACKDYIERNPEIGGNMAYFATAARECDGFSKAEASVVEKRERWLREVSRNFQGQGREPQRGEASPAPQSCAATGKDEEQ